MIEDNEHAFTRQMLGRAEMKKAPDYLGDAIMQKIRQEQERQIYRKLLLTMSLKVACIFIILCLLAIPLIRKGIRVDNTLTTLQNAGHAIADALKQFYVVVPFVVLLLFGKV